MADSAYRSTVQMKLQAACTAIFLFGCNVTSYAADADAKNQPAQAIIPSLQLNGYLKGYSVELDTDRPESPKSTAPQGLSDLKRNSFHPFLGFKLTRPLETK